MQNLVNSCLFSSVVEQTAEVLTSCTNLSPMTVAKLFNLCGASPGSEVIPRGGERFTHYQTLYQTLYQSLPDPLPITTRTERDKGKLPRFAVSRWFGHSTMDRCLFLLCIPLAFSGSSADNEPKDSPSYRVGDVRNCPVKSPQDDSQPLYQMEVLPGVGFDNLRNLDMGQVHVYNFSNCQVSKDGKFLLPDSIFLLPVQESKINVYAEYFDHWDNYTSMTSNSINLDVGFYSIVSGKFSAGYSITKSHMHNDIAKSTRVQIRNKLYTVKLQPGAELHPTFKSRLYDIASSIQNNNTEYAQYLSELLIRDYGTHYVSSMDAGAVLSQTDFIRSTDATDMFKYSSYVKASASANFFQKVHLGASFQHGSSQSDTTEFINNRTFSQVVTVGGPPFTPNMTLEEWEKGVPDTLVAIDRSGDPLHFVVNPLTDIIK